jgi:PhnB protein
MKKAVKDESMSWVIPYLIVADAGAAAQYYADHFGFEILSLAKGDDGKAFHAELRYKDIVIMCGTAGFSGEMIETPAMGNFVSPVNLYVYHEDVDGLYNVLIAHGVKTEAAPEDQFWGDRMFRVVDNDGHQWSFATKVAEHI